ncbi:MAG: efflux RND transporter periplasmic adaptor subunit [Candidatus Melainabacteria bacterium]|nr:efflux RND transporter periplasmic adaptor subunit [Candidatus Melainabacteria bacterium]
MNTFCSYLKRQVLELIQNHEQWQRMLPLCIAVSILASSCQADKGKEGKPEQAAVLPSVKVKVEVVEPSQVNDKVTFIGRLDSREAVAIMPKVDGNIQRILVKPGDHVKKGQLLVEIDSLKQQAAVATKISDVATAQAEYQKELAGLQSLNADREAQVASVEYDQHEYTRNYWLEQRGVVSESTVDSYNRMYLVAKAKLKEIDANITAQKQVIEKAARAIDAANFSKQEQVEQLAFYKITAPFPGTVADIPAKVGDYVNSSTKLTTVSQLRPLEVEVLVPKLIASSLRQGMPIEILDDNDKSIASCPIFHIDPIVDQDNQSVLVKALFDNAGESYRPDQTVSTKVVMSQRQGISIPTEALSFIAGRAFAYVVGGQAATPVAEQRALKIASLEGNRAVLNSGIKAGEKVVVSGVQNLREGSPLEIE